MANRMYTGALNGILDGSIDLANDTIRVMLVGSGYAFDPDDDFVSSGAGTPGGEEISGTGYVAGFGNAGRQLVDNISLNRDDTNNRMEVLVSLDNVWSAIDAGTIAAAIIWKPVTNDADSILIAFIDTANPNFPVTTVGQDFELDWSSEGLIQFPA